MVVLCTGAARWTRMGEVTGLQCRHHHYHFYYHDHHHYDHHDHYLVTRELPGQDAAGWLPVDGLRVVEKL